MSEYFKEIEKLTKDDLLSQKTAEELFCIDEPERTVTYNLLCDRAKELEVLVMFKGFIKIYKKYVVDVNPLYTNLELELTNKATVKNKTANFVKILRGDEYFNSLKLNNLTRRIELNGEPMTELTVIKMRVYIEKEYGIYNRSALNAALEIVSYERKYLPTEKGGGE